MSTDSALWQVPAALTHATWQAAHAECYALASQSGVTSITLDWQACKQVDSSALAFVLDLKRSANKPVRHHQAPVQLLQLAKLYEVDGVLGLH
jgi:ABC-type transporter Mla MlaB component